MSHINEMEAGPELDVLVAEQVMGWTYRSDNPVNMECPEVAEPGWWHSPEWQDGDWECASCLFKYQSDVMPRYSSDIAAAWKVLEKLVEMKKGACVHGYSADEWACSYSKRVGVVQFIQADTAQLAICRAALFLVEE